MHHNSTFDCAIIGGGLAGLCLAIQLCDGGAKVVLFEKNKYPFHKVCGEYISMESWDFLVRLGLPLPEMNLPKINKLGISSTKGFMLEADLQLGGFGISRYSLDFALVELARKKGVVIHDNCKVTKVDKNENDPFEIISTIGSTQAKLCFGAYGKISPSFMEKISPPKTQYIGVKYHIKTNFPSDRIELHNFKGGYCGISKIDNETFCLCYLSLASNLIQYEKDLKKMEENVLMENPFLKSIFEQSTFLYEKPLTISNITFQAKSTVNQQMFTLGDAAGAIAPLCGNGMSMAMRASSILADLSLDLLHEKSTLSTVERNYNRVWQSALGNRIKAGYYLQNLFGNNFTTHLALKTLSHTPNLLQKLIRLTHGNPF